MSSINDELQEVVERAWQSYRHLSKGHTQLKSTLDSVLALLGPLQLVNELAREQGLSPIDNGLVQDAVDDINSVLSDLETALTRFKAGEVTIERVLRIQSKVQDVSGQIESLFRTLRRHDQEKIISVLEQIPNIEDAQPQHSMLNKELLKAGLSQDLIDGEFYFIDDWVKHRFRESPVTESEVMNDDAELPGYSPGSHREGIAEKIHVLEQTTTAMTLDVAAGIAGASAEADPPPYAFEKGDQSLMDEVFNKFIKSAIADEASLLKTQQENNPVTALSWLPKYLQAQYYEVDGFVTTLAPDSFTTMAYRTSSNVLSSIARLQHLVHIREDQKGTESILNEISTSLNTIHKATMKLSLLQNQRSVDSEMSDLDAIYLEYSTALFRNDRLEFPMAEFEFARRSLYQLLTFIMGFLGVVNFFFEGKTYITRSLVEVAELWKESQMNARTAWIEKQLTRWSQVAEAVNTCREWHARQPLLRDQAITALQDWNKAQDILSGGDESDMIELTVVSATGFPSSSFGTPSGSCNVVFYSSNQFGGAMRSAERKTNISPKTVNPVWNATFEFKVPKIAKMIQVEVYVHSHGLVKEAYRIKLDFNFVPGVEASFAQKSLMYGFDDELDFPLNSTAGKGKGKGKEASLKLRLKWKGRIQRCEEAGLPTSPPGKMFKPDMSGNIPLSREQKELLKKKRLLSKPPGSDYPSGRPPPGGGARSLEAASDIAGNILDLLGNLS